MFTSNFHSHSDYSDGKGSLEDLVLEAKKLGLNRLGISDHAPISIESSCNMKKEVFQNYIDNINNLKIKYSNDLKIYSGLEVDYLEGLFDKNYNEKFKVDFYIGSLHFIRHDGQYYPVDASPKEQADFVNKFFNGDYNSFIKKYFLTYCEMIENYNPTFFGHLDLYKKFNKNMQLFDNDSKIILNYATEAIKLLSEKSAGLEVNVGGICRGWIDQPYPSLKMLKICKDLNIKIILNSDAHSADSLIKYFDIGMEYIREAGYKGEIASDGIPFIYD